MRSSIRLAPSARLVVAVTTALGLAAALAACGVETSDPNLFAPYPARDSGTPSGGDSGTETPGTDSGTSNPGTDSGAPATDSGTPGTDSGTPAADNAFTGAPAYVATTGRNARKNAHGGNGNPAKLACLTCHKAGGSGPTWFAGGTVYADAAGTTPVAQAEVRIRDAAGKAASTYTDADGNFYFTPAQATGLAFPLQVGARTGAVVRTMSAKITMGDCSASACHQTGAAGFIHVP